MEQQLLNYGGALVLIFLLTVSFVKPLMALYLMPYAFSLSPEIAVGETAKRAITVRLEDLLIAVLLIRVFFDFIISKSFPLERLRKNQFFSPMFMYSMALIIATTTGVALLRVSPAAGFFYVLKLIQFFLFFFVFVYYIQDEKDIKIILNGSLITMAIVTIIAYIQIPTLPRVSMPFEGKSPEPNTFGGYYVLLGAVLTGLSAYEPKGRKKTLYIALLIAAVAPFIYTKSRTSWISMGAVLVIFLLLTKGLQKKVAILIVIILIFMSLPLMPTDIKERFQFWKPEEGFERTETVGRIKFDPSASERIEQYRRMPRLFVKSPLVGHGVTGAGFFDGQYIRTIVETGLLGVMTFLYLNYAILRYLYSSYRYRTDTFSRGMSIGLLCAAVGLLIHCIGASTFMIVRIMEPYTMFLALLVSYNRMIEQKRAYELPAIAERYTYPYLVTAPVEARRL